MLHSKLPLVRKPLLWLVASALFMVTNACDSSMGVRATDPKLMEPISDLELQAIANRAPPDAREDMLAALRASVEKSKNISDRPVEVRVGEYRYRIPLNYFNPWGEDNPSVKVQRFSGFKAFLPDYRGYDRKNFIDAHHPDKVEVTWYAEGESSDVEVEYRLNRALKSKDIEPTPSFRRDGLDGYKKSRPIWGEIVWIGTGTHGQLLFIECSPDAPNPLCDVRYHNKKNRYWLYYHFNVRHLAKWREIDDNINRLIISWRVSDSSATSPAR